MESQKIPEDVALVVNAIVKLLNPVKVYLFSSKRGGVGKTKGFKLCVILSCSDMAEAERQIYLGVDCEVPFDVVLYSPELWQELCARKGSLAQRILCHGVLVYG